MAALMEEYERLDAEDHVAGVACRFRYREVPAEDYGLRTEDLLLLPDKELNQARLCSRQPLLGYPSWGSTALRCLPRCAGQATCRPAVKAAHALPTALPFVYGRCQLLRICSTCAVAKGPASLPTELLQEDVQRTAGLHLHGA